MEYFSILNLHREPFSNAPDPDFFFQSRQHLTCLHKLELSLRLRRGLNVVIGDVGTGKTTLCRQLIRRLADDETMEIHLIPDPHFNSPSESLREIAGLFGCLPDPAASDERHVREQIRRHLFQKGVGEKKVVTLLIDEGQKISDFFLEILREFLNYETNQYKLLQIVIFAQTEFEQTLTAHANFSDRVSFCFYLGPLGFGDMKKMIRFRLAQSGAESTFFFSPLALWEIYRVSCGYPRKIIHLCHQSILMMIVRGRPGVGWAMVRSCSGRWNRAVPVKKGRGFVVAGAAFLAGIAIWGLISPDPLKMIARHVGSVRVEETVPSLKTGAEHGEMPTVLGHICVKSDETLGALIKNIYGAATPRLLREVMRVNPFIKNPHRIAIGQQITFPAVPATADMSAKTGYRVEISATGDIESAFRRLRLYNSEEMPLRLIPCWTPPGGLKFLLVVDEYFSDRDSAQRRLNDFQAEYPVAGRITNSWPEDTVFLSDPSTGAVKAPRTGRGGGF
ncbi:hypothetical protein DENIS_0059 [Desulfonema ishimotonii]|uniref:AAA+ ATPase domain-containing protein n=1 Tax=Desulfonema ishimotonii TaxID=45657 RepID=A0A401FQ58_9BACT|nr:AAA family ATPase [Desulfonema ishimotonii]GBC59123.1 hypothetical protein DENIS_0059 [Desulfonema ishimotonii]